MNAFLALSVDKLSEIRDLEEDESKEKESEEKERKEREEQLCALKNPEPEVRRRTIRRLLRFQAHNPTERLKSVQQSTKNRWWKQLSLPQFSRESTFRDIKRSISTPTKSAAASPASVPVSSKQLGIIEEEEEGSGGGGGDVGFVSVQGSKRRKNPLSHVQNPSSYTDVREPQLKLSGLEHVNVASMASSSRLARMQSRQSPALATMEEAKLEGEDDNESVFKYEQRQMSVVSSPATVEGGKSREQRGLLAPSETSQSLPVTGDPAVFDFKVKRFWCWLMCWCYCCFVDDVIVVLLMM